jgi:hypothetical protein
MVPSSLDAASLADVFGDSRSVAHAVASSTNTPEGRTMNGFALLRLLKDVGLLAPDFGAMEVEAALRYALYDEGPQDLVGAGIVDTSDALGSTITPHMATERDDVIRALDGGCVLVPDDSRELEDTQVVVVNKHQHSSLGVLGAEMTLVDLPVALAYLFGVLLCRANTRVSAARDHRRRVEVLVEEARRDAKERAMAEAIRAQEAAAAAKPAKGKKPAEPSAPTVETPRIDVDHVALGAGEAPPPPFLFPGSSRIASGPELLAARERSPTSRVPMDSDGAPFGVKMEAFLTKVVFQRLGLEGFSEMAHAIENPFEEGGLGSARLSARRE